MEDSVAKRRRAAMVGTIAVAEQIGVLFAFAASDITQRPDWRDQDIFGSVHLILYALIFMNGVFAYALYAYSQRLLADIWSAVWWAGLAMAISPWTTFLLTALPRPDFVPWQIVVLAGAAGPYALIAARLRPPRQSGA